MHGTDKEKNNQNTLWTSKKKIILFRVQECDKIIDEKTDENEISSKDTINSHTYYFYEILCS